jgi:TIR domain-containing protein
MAPVYDVFLSHSTADKPAVERLAHKLSGQGIKPFLDQWHLVPGEPWQEALEEALDQSRTCAVFVGPTGLGPWQNEEMRSALEKRVRNPAFRVIPVLLPGTHESQRENLPFFLRRLAWVDFRAGLEDEGALRHLVRGIQGMSRGPEGETKPPARRWHRWLWSVALPVLVVCLGIYGVLVWRSHVLLLVPGEEVFELLPAVDDRDPGPRDLVCSLDIRFQNESYMIRDLRRQPIYLGAPGRLWWAVPGASGSEWVQEVKAWSWRSLTPGEETILSTLSKVEPQLLKTGLLPIGEKIETRLTCTKDGVPRPEIRAVFRVDGKHEVQPVFLAGQNEVP